MWGEERTGGEGSAEGKPEHICTDTIGVIWWRAKGDGKVAVGDVKKGLDHGLIHLPLD